MHSTLTETGLALWTASWQGALLAVAVAVVCRLIPGKIPPRLQFVLWGVVFARLAMPMLPASEFSAERLWNFASVAPMALVAEDRAGPVSAIQSTVIETGAVGHSATETSPPDTAFVPASPSLSLATPVVESEHANTSSGFAQRLPALIVTGWLIGIGLLGLRHLWQSRRLHQFSRHWQLADDAPLNTLLEECRQCTGVRRPVQLLLADASVGPAMFGLLRPCIVLPESTAATASPEELRMLLLHELSHIRRHDVLWDRLAMTVAAVHWFNPAAWWALAALRDTREQACDADVLRCLGSTQAASYGRLVLSLASWCGSERTPAVLVGATGSTRSLQRRIEMIGAYRTATWKQSAIGIAAIIGLVLCGLTSAPAPQAAESDPAAVQAVGNDVTTAAAKASNDANDADGAGAPPLIATAVAYGIDGTCVDENDAPLQGVKVRLFRVNTESMTQEQVAEAETDADGKYRFDSLPPPERAAESAETDEDYAKYYAVVAQLPGRASQLWNFVSSRSPSTDVKLTMSAAATLSGRVTDASGQPVAGAVVFTGSLTGATPITGACMDITDADGRYDITDLNAWDAANEKPQKIGEDVYFTTSECNFTVRHPQYGMVQPTYKKVPATVDVTLEPAAVIEGLVTDQVTGQPVAGASVSMQGAGRTNGWQRVLTDAAGRYELTSVATGTYNVWAEASERTCVAIDSLQVEPGQRYDRDIELIEGSWLEGRVVDATTGRPVWQDKGQPLHVAIYGPSRPKSGAAVAASPVGPDGRFGLRVAPGRNYPYIMTWEVWQRTEDQSRYQEGIDVGEGELVVLEFRVWPTRPKKKPESPVRQPLPVSAEREAAAAVRRLGGWYEVDNARHVVEVNMVYHETAEDVRYDNSQVDTDEILKWVPQFPHLKRLFLKEGQATDDSLAFVSELHELETIIVWDADAITDAGVEHLRGMDTLKTINLGDSAIGDASLALFGTLPNLESLGLQGKNRFTDDGVLHLVGLPSLKSLWISSGKAQYTTRIAKNVARLTGLQELDLQGIPLADADIRKLAALTNLRRISLGGAPAGSDERITDASLDVFMGWTQLEHLLIQDHAMTDAAALQLAAHPSLKELYIDANSLSDEATHRMKAEHPEKRIFFSGRR